MIKNCLLKLINKGKGIINTSNFFSNPFNRINIFYKYNLHTFNTTDINNQDKLNQNNNKNSEIEIKEAKMKAKLNTKLPKENKEINNITENSNSTNIDNIDNLNESILIKDENLITYNCDGCGTSMQTSKPNKIGFINKEKIEEYKRNLTKSFKTSNDLDSVIEQQKHKSEGDKVRPTINKR